MTNEDLIETKPAINQILTQKRIPIRLAYDFQDRLERIEEALKTYESTRDGLIKKLGKADPRADKGRPEGRKEAGQLCEAAPGTAGHRDRYRI